MEKYRGGSDNVPT